MSVYCKQAFSFAGNIVTKLRSKLSYETIDDLCFEKSYFLKENQNYMLNIITAIYSSAKNE